MSLYVPYRMQTFLVKGQEMSHVDRIISHERSHCTCAVRLNKTDILWHKPAVRIQWMLCDDFPASEPHRFRA
jgi:hypothetical protein